MRSSIVARVPPVTRSAVTMCTCSRSRSARAHIIVASMPLDASIAAVAAVARQAAGLAGSGGSASRRHDAAPARAGDTDGDGDVDGGRGAAVVAAATTHGGGSSGSVATTPAEPSAGMNTRPAQGMEVTAEHSNPCTQHHTTAMCTCISPGAASHTPSPSSCSRRATRLRGRVSACVTDGISPAIRDDLRTAAAIICPRDPPRGAAAADVTASCSVPTGPACQSRAFKSCAWFGSADGGEAARRRRRADTFATSVSMALK